MHFAQPVSSMFLSGGDGGDVHEKQGRTRTSLIIPTEITLLRLARRQFLLQLLNHLCLVFSRSSASSAATARLVSSFLFKFRIFLLDVDEIENNVEGSREDEGKEECEAG